MIFFHISDQLSSVTDDVNYKSTIYADDLSDVFFEMIVVSLSWCRSIASLLSS